MRDKRTDGFFTAASRRMPGCNLFRRKPRPRPAFTAESRSGTGRSDVLIATFGIGLGLVCALFPWYIFFNQEQFGIRALKFEGNGQTEGPIELSAQSDRVGAPSESVEISPYGARSLRNRNTSETARRRWNSDARIGRSAISCHSRRIPARLCRQRPRHDRRRHRTFCRATGFALARQQSGRGDRAARWPLGSGHHRRPDDRTIKLSPPPL